MSKLGIIAATAVAAGAFAPGSTQAITYGEPDCGPGGCAHPNVVMLTGLRSGPAGGTRFQCSGSLVQRTESYYLILTAGHCTFNWSVGIAAGAYSSVGVSFDPVVARKAVPDGSISMDESQFAAGGVPVTHPEIGPNVNAFILKSDYGIVSVPRASVDAKWPTAATLPVVALAYEVPLKLEALVAATSAPQRDLAFFAVGYGWTERLNFGSNAGGPHPPGTGLGTRRVAGPETFTNLRATLLQTSQNPALGNAGTCNGDSGGPLFYQTAGGLVQVGITASGDAMCRATQTSSRMDTDAAAWFVECARVFPGNVQNCGF
jgi:hypothetical protein